jgi:hypothetical protein
VSGARVAPSQRQLKAIAERGMSGHFDFAPCHTLAFRWERWSAVALLTGLVGLARMVLNPFQLVVASVHLEALRCQHPDQCQGGNQGNGPLVQGPGAEASCARMR